MRILFFRQPVSLMDRDLIYTFQKRGIEVFIEDIHQEFTAEGHCAEMFSLERIQEILEKFKPDMVLSFNASGLDNGGVISREYESRGIPYCTWFVDRPRVADIGDKYVKTNSYLFVFDRGYIQTLKGAGFEHVFHLPLATNPDRFRPIDGVKRDNQVCFIGDLDFKTIQYLSSNIDAMVEGADDTFYKSVERAIQAQLKRIGEDTWVIIEDTFHESNIPTKDFPQIFRDMLEGFVEREAGLRLRLETMKELSTQFSTVVYGDPMWEDVLGHRYHGKINYFTDEIVNIYNHHSININISKFQLRTAINQRPFDVPACGGFLITDIRDDLFDFFEHDEMVYFGSTEELIDKTRDFLNNEPLRQEFIKKARKRVLLDHTYDNRIDEMMKKVKGQSLHQKIESEL